MDKEKSVAMLLFESKLSEARRRYRISNPERYVEQRKTSKANYKLNHPEKVLAQKKVSNAVSKGRLIRPENCSNCFREDLRIEAHHTDYSKPYDITWLCSQCHRGVVIPK